MIIQRTRLSIPALDTPIHGWPFAATLLAVWAICSVPLCFTTYPPLLDYPSHLARMYVLAHWQEVSLFREAYNPPVFLIPNIGMDALMLALSRIMSVEIAGRVFLALLMLLTLSGSSALYWSIERRLTLWPLVGAAFLYNWILLDGFLSYLLGVALMLWGLGAWIASYDGPRLKRILVGASFALVMFFCHLSAFGLFALAVGGYTLARTLRETGRSLRGLGTSAASLAAVFAAPTVLLLLSSTGKQADANLTYMWISKPFAFRALFSANALLDIFLWPLIILIAVWLKRRHLRIDPDMRLPLALVLLAFLALPEGMMSGWYVASRLIIAAWLLLLAASSPAAGAPSASPWLTLTVAIFLVYRSLILGLEWHSYDRLTAELGSALDALPANSTVFSATTERYGPGHFAAKSSMQPPVWHWADLAVLRSQAFVPAMHALPGQQPLTISGRFADIYAYQANNPISVKAGEAGRPARAFARWLGVPRPEHPDLRTVVADIRALAQAAGIDPSRVFLLLLNPSDLPETAAVGGEILARGERFLLINPGPPGKE